MSLSEEIKVQVERLRTYAAHNPSAIITEVADALAAVREEQRCKTCGANGSTAPCAYPTERVREQAVEIARLREANAELLEGLRDLNETMKDRASCVSYRNEIEALIAKHGGK